VKDPLRIALVDDDRDLRFLTQTMLAKALPQAEFLEFMTAQTMIDHLREHEVDAIVTDYQLGTMDGIEMIRTIRQTDTTTPIVMASGRDDIRDAALAAGATIFLTFREQRQMGDVLKRLLAQPC
jgi:DNA-binding response OmpR family regulator